MLTSLLYAADRDSVQNSSYVFSKSEATVCHAPPPLSEVDDAYQQADEQNSIQTVSQCSPGANGDVGFILTFRRTVESSAARNLYAVAPPPFTVAPRPAAVAPPLPIRFAWCSGL